MSLELWLCTRFAQPVEITRRACAALAKAAARKHTAPCFGCPGVRAIAKAAGSAPREADTSHCTPPAQIPKFHGQDGQPHSSGRPARHHRNDPFTAAMAAKGKQ